MRVMPEDVVLELLGRCVGLSGEILPFIRAHGTEPVPAPVAGRFAALVKDIHGQKRSDSILSDESWEWIWEVKAGMNHLQMYGRLAWLNYNLFDLL